MTLSTLYGSGALIGLGMLVSSVEALVRPATPAEARKAGAGGLDADELAMSRITNKAMALEASCMMIEMAWALTAAYAVWFLWMGYANHTTALDSIARAEHEQ